MNPRPTFSAWRTCAAALLFAAFASAANAQQVTTPDTEPPPIPSGSGVVRGTVVHATDPSRVAGIPVVLYGLSSEGEPGLANTRTDARGQFRFEGVTTEESMAYLVGAKYGDIPFFGPSASFGAGASTLEVQVEVADPTPDGSGISVAEVIVQVEWVGGQLAVQELHRVRNNSETVVLVEDAQRGDTTPAPFATQLPVGASDFLPMAMGFEDAFEEQKGRVRYWGPIYPGGQDIRFQYLLPARNGDTPIAIRLPMGAGLFSLLTAADGPVIGDAGSLIADEDVELDGRRFNVLRGADLARNAEIVFAVEMAVTSNDIRRLTMPRADLWLELDDTQLVTTFNVELKVEGADGLASRGEEPLLQFPLPKGAELLDMSPETRSLGIAIQQSAESTFAELRGPIPPGQTSMRLRYRVPSTPEGVHFELAFPQSIQTLNVLIADLDTGIELESDRLHRRRPFRQGTRMYLHREAFQVAAGETLPITLRPTLRAPLSPTLSKGIAVGAVGLALVFLLAPLRSSGTEHDSAGLHEFAMRREAVYQDILDLDHDFETGKLDAADHIALRDELRSQIAALLVEERSAPESDAPAAPVADNCPGCGGATEPQWTFCSSCGANLGTGSDA